MPARLVATVALGLWLCGPAATGTAVAQSVAPDPVVIESVAALDSTLAALAEAVGEVTELVSPSGDAAEEVDDDAGEEADNDADNGEGPELDLSELRRRLEAALAIARRVPPVIDPQVTTARHDRIRTVRDALERIVARIAEAEGGDAEDAEEAEAAIVEDVRALAPLLGDDPEAG